MNNIIGLNTDILINNINHNYYGKLFYNTIKLYNERDIRDNIKLYYGYEQRIIKTKSTSSLNKYIFSNKTLTISECARMLSLRSADITMPILHENNVFSENDK